MFFSTNNSRIYLSLISRPKNIWYLLTMSICLLFFSTWWVFLNKPLNKIIKSQSIIINNLKSSLDKNLQDKNFKIINNNNNLVDNNFEKRTLEERFRFLKQEFQENSGINKIIKLIEDADKSGLKIKLYDLKPEMKKSWYSKHIFELNLTGNFEMISKFMEKISNTNVKLKFIEFVANSSENNALINLKLIIQMLDIKNENI